jgi:hypothetical protein
MEYSSGQLCCVLSMILVTLQWFDCGDTCCKQKHDFDAKGTLLIRSFPWGGNAVVAIIVTVLEVCQGEVERIATCSKHHLLH